MKALLTRIRDGLSETPRGVIAAVIYYMVLIVSCAVQSAIMDRDLFAYDISMLRAIVCMSVSVRGVWLLITRAHSARWFCVFGTSAFLLLSAIDLVFVGAFAEIEAVTGTLVAVLLLLFEFGSGIGVITYLIGSSKIHAFLFEPDASDRGSNDPSPVSSLPLRQRIKTWPFWRDTGIYFIVFSMLGHWAEILFCRLIILGVFMGDYDPSNIMLWDQWLFPFSAEGIALVMVVLLLHPLKERFLKRFGGRKLPTLLASFALNLAVCTSIDFLTGMAVNQDYSLWDYRALPFNFMGQVCLQNALFFGFVATIMTWLVYPSLERFFRRVPNESMTVVFVVVLVGFIILMALYYINITPSDINGALGESTSTADAAGSVSSAAVSSSSAA
jgi:uncharacterized membrane protein